MYEKVSKCHIDKVADRIAGAIVDLAYANKEEPKIAVEVLIGHKKCSIIVETDTPNLTSKDSCKSTYQLVEDIVHRIAGEQFKVDLQVVPQDISLANNQKDKMRTGDNGIFRGVRLSWEEKELSRMARYINDEIVEADGKYLIDNDKITICQSGIDTNVLKELICEYFKNDDYTFTINPLGNWVNDLDNDTGVTGRKIGSDLGRGATGGAICGKDLTKSDVSINIFLHLLLNKKNTLLALCPDDLQWQLESLCDYLQVDMRDYIETTCSIGDDIIYIDGFDIEFEHIVKIVKRYIDIAVGGFEKLAEWGLV